MAKSDFELAIRDTAVDVAYTPSASEPRGKLFGFIVTICIIVAVTCALLFLPGKRGEPSMWHDLANAQSDSLVFFIFVFVPLIGLMGWQGSRYARAAWPSNETFHCDSKALTISRIPWLDFSNRTWRTHTYPLSEVKAIRFAVIASAKNRSYWGLRFQSHGRKWALPGLEAPEAKQILTALRALGADAPDDPELDERIKKILEMRSSDTSWMDRSWMNSNKQ
jgi:hypothetical protein